MLEQIKGTPLGRSISTLLKLKLKSKSNPKYDRLFTAIDELKKFLFDRRDYNDYNKE